MQVVTSWFLIATTPLGLAQGPPNRSPAEAEMVQGREIYSLGAALYESGRYDEALAAFRRAYAITGKKVILYNMASAQERLGDLPGAIESLRDYLPFASTTRAASLQLRILALEERVATSREAIELVSPAPVPPSEPVVPPPPAPRTRIESRPRWGLVAVGGSLIGGFGSMAILTYLDGRTDVDAADALGYRRNLVLNNVALSAAGLGGALVVLGVAFPHTTNVVVTATPASATLTVRM